MTTPEVSSISISARTSLVVAAAAIALILPASSAHAAGSGSIEGKITGPGGIPITKAFACAYLVGSEEFAENCIAAGSDGTYSIGGLPAGSYVVEFWSEAVEPSYVGEFYDDQPFWEEANEVTVEAGVATPDIDAELAEGATIEGQVDAPSLGGPVESALICAQAPSGEPLGCVPDRFDGSYMLLGLPAGEYKVQFIPAAFTYNLLNQFYDHKSGWAEADPLALAAGETRTGIDADLEAGAEIHGTVYSAATGSPLSEILVCAVFWQEQWEEWVTSFCRPTSANGSYTLEALATHSYRVAFSPEPNEFGPEYFPEPDDGYFVQYFDGKPTLAAANPLSVAAPAVLSGIDAHLQSKNVVATPSPVSPSSTSLSTTPAPPRKPARHCRAGFRRKTVAGKRRCVRRHKHKRRNHRR